MTFYTFLYQDHIHRGRVTIGDLKMQLSMHTNMPEHMNKN